MVRYKHCKNVQKKGEIFFLSCLCLSDTRHNRFYWTSSTSFQWRNRSLEFFFAVQKKSRWQPLPQTWWRWCWRLRKHLVSSSLENQYYYFQKYSKHMCTTDGYLRTHSTRISPLWMIHCRFLWSVNYGFFVGLVEKYVFC